MADGGSLSIVGLTSENSSVDVFTWPGKLQDPVVRVVSTGVEVWAYNTKAGATQLQGSYSYTRPDEYIGLSTTSGGTVSYEIGDEVAINTSGSSYSLYVVTLTKNDYFTCTDELKSIADAIRTKGGTSASLIYPDGFVTAINNLPTKVLGLGVIGQDTPFDTQVTAQDYSDGNWDGFSSVNVSIETPVYDGSCDIINPLITFTIAGTTYQAEEGMTWAEWIDSSYNINSYIISGGVVKPILGTVYDLYSGHIRVSSADTIIENNNYSWASGGGGAD